MRAFELEEEYTHGVRAGLLSLSTVAEAEHRLGKEVQVWLTCPRARGFTFSAFSCRFFSERSAWMAARVG